MWLQGIFALPDDRHVPGTNARPAGGPVLAAAAAARLTFDPAVWSASPAYLYGFDLLAGGFFWEAHEVWEPVWMRCLPNSRERALVQALIQRANAGLKGAMGRHGATIRLLRLAAILFDDATGPGPVMGIDAALAAAALRAIGSGDEAAREIAGCCNLRPMCIIMQ